MIRKFFPLDKNYLLEEAQLSLQDPLLLTLIEKVKTEYMQRHNPLGVMDEHTKKIIRYRPKNLKLLHPFYQNMAGVYRYKFGDSQLEILWDGTDHVQNYKDEWSSVFDQWTSSFCEHHQFLMAVMDLTVFLPANRKAHLAENRMNSFITQFFDLKIHKNRGIVEMKVA
ncbi:MAG TPA: hypothetical protein DIS90_11785 [Cytophagales bacterium]|nr:hypothetical protein [Cytophagales bacterium]HCR54490.1 hypothetical protein [Cytophagales bacterium]